MRVDLFDFDLPPGRIALRPARPRDAARMLVVRGEGGFEDLGVRDLPRLKLRGLMALPPPRESFEDQKRLFDRVAALLQELQAAGFEVDTLSMGMSADLEAAIAAGATFVRVGTALFGERHRA